MNEGIVKEEQQEVQTHVAIELSEAEKEDRCDSSESSMENMRCRDCTSEGDCLRRSRYEKSLIHIFPSIPFSSQP